MANQNQIKFGVGYLVDKASVLKVKQSLRLLQTIKIGDFKGTRAELDKVKDTAKLVENALLKAFNVNLNSLNTKKFTQELNTAKLSIDQIYTNFSKAGSQGQVAFSKMASAVLTTNMQLKETKSLITSMGLTMMNTVKWGIASSVMNTFTNSVRQAFDYVKNLDSALTDIRIVTGDSTLKMAQFAEQANKAAQSLGRSTMDYTKAALTFYQQGLNDEDVQARTQSVLVAQNITGAGSEMADYLTAVWNGYKVANEEAELYVDKLAAVADSSASNMSLLAIAMSKVASTANMLGVPVDNLNAQIATIIATTRQAPESVGNALKTIYARINDIATGADDALISLGNYSEKMAEVGISVLDANGKLRDTGDVIDEVGQKWTTLSREQQIYLARTMAGQRQYNNLLALFENWGRYTDLVNISMDAQGAAMEKNERYMDSLAAKMEQFGAAEERVKSALINLNDLKGITDFGTQVVNLFASLIEGIGGGGNAILALGSIVTSVFGNVIAKEFNNAITNFKNFKNNAEIVKQDLENTQLFGQSQGYSQNVIKEMVAAKELAQSYYKFMTDAQKNEYNGYVQNIAQAKEENLVLQERQSIAENFAKKFAHSKHISIIGEDFAALSDKVIIQIEKIEDKVQEMNTTLSKTNTGSQVLKDLKNSFNEIQNSLGKTPTQNLEAYSKYEQALAKIKDIANPTSQLLGKVQRAILLLTALANQKLTLAGDLENINQLLSKSEAKLKMTQQAAKEYLENIKQFANVKSFVNIAAGLGQVASIISTVVNLTKTWKNENLSLGEKLTQTFTTIGFLVPMIVSAYKNIISGLGFQVTQLQRITREKAKQLLTLQLTTAEVQKQIALRQLEKAKKKDAANNAAAALLYGDDEVDWNSKSKEVLMAEQALKNANKALQEATVGLKTLEGQADKTGSVFGSLGSMAKRALGGIIGFLSGPGGIILAIGALATIIGVSLYKAWNRAKEAALQATKQMQAANDVYKQSKDNLNELKSSLESLKNAKNSLNELTTGTKEWKSALEDVNNQVIELLEKYPQLAENGRIITNSNGMLLISEEGQLYLLNQQRRATQASAMGYLSSRQRSDLANREYKITLLSRDLGLGAFNSSVLDKTITAYQEYGDQIFTNTKELQNLIGANEKQITAIDLHKNEIISLAKELTANTTATQSLTQSIITGTFVNPEDIAKSVNSDILLSEFSKNFQNVELDYTKYGIDPNKRNIDQDSIQLSILPTGIAGNENYIQKLSSQVSDLAGISAEAMGYAETGKLFLSSESKALLLNRFKELMAGIEGEIQESSDGIIKRVDLSGEILATYTYEDIMNMVASADADIEKITLQSLQIAQKYVNLFGEQASTVYKIGLGTLAAGDVSIQDYYKLSENADFYNALWETFELLPTEVDLILSNLVLQTKNNLLTYLLSLPESIQQSLKNLSYKLNQEYPELSEYAQKAIGASLQNAWKNGTYDEYLNILNSLETEDLQDFVTFVDSLGEDINSIDTNSFIDKMKELGISTENVAGQQVQELINKLKELNNIDINIQDNIGQLYEGATSFLEKYAKDTNATLSKSEFESLSQLASGLNLDLSQYFDQTWKGTYKLKTTAEEFIATINNITLEGFEQKIQEVEDKLNNLQDVQQIKANTDITGLQLANYINDSATLWNNRDYYNNLGANVYQTGAQILASLEIPDISNNKYIEELLNGGKSQGAVQFLLDNLQLVIDGWNLVDESIIKAKEDLELYKTQQEDAALAQEEMNQKLREMQLDDSVNVDLWKNLASYIQEMADEAGFELIYDGLTEDKEAALNLAELILRFASAVEEVSEKYDTWLSQLSSGSIIDEAKAASLLNDVYSDLLNLPFDDGLTSNFTTDITNLQDLQAAVQGDELAYRRLQIAAQEDIALKVGFDNLDFQTGFNALLDEYYHIQSLDDLLIGASLNDENFLNGLSDMVNAAGMSATEATNYLASMGIDANVVLQDNAAEETHEIVGYRNVPETILRPIQRFDGRALRTYVETFNSSRIIPEVRTVQGKKENKAFALKVESAQKSSGGGFKYTHVPGHTSSGSKGSGGGGGGKGGGGGSAKQPSTAKISTDTISTKAKLTPFNPYEEVEKSYERQEDLLKDLDLLEKHLQGEDRLNNIQKQNKELIKQNSIIEERQKISKDAAELGTTAWYRNQLLVDEALKDVVRFDPDGQVNETVSKQAITDAFNRLLAEQKAYYEAAQNSYNSWIENVWNKYSGEQQLANKKQKEQYDEDLKNAKKNALDKIKIAEEEYNDRTKLLENYQKALEEDNKFYEQYLDNIEKLIENRIAESKIKVDLAFDFGLTERQWQEFENKFIKRLQKDDIFANAKASFRELQSYFNSSEITLAQKEIDKVRKEIALIQSGQYSSIYGITRQEFDNLSETDRNNLQKRFLDLATKDLQDYQKKLMDSLEEVQDKQEEIQELYLDSIDKAKDKMDDVISQYERINDLVEHNIKLTELLYGDNAGFDIRNGYYNRQSLNNTRMLENLRQQQAYWQSQLNNATPDTEDWRRFKENLENVTDAINSALENQLDLLATKFENKIQGALANIQNKLTNGLGNTFLDNQWEFINADDEAFLDAVNSKFGIDEIEQLYEDAAADAEGNITQQQRINKLMNDQLKALREKDKLTQYDIDRAKAALEVEKARMALEDARNNKTKMRLRRDSQGNYTYQYVADEEKLSDLQSALANAESLLYNMDKEHYKQQLNEMYDIYKDYLERRADLEREMQATQDENERARIQARIKLLEETYTEYADNITGDLQYTLSNYLTESTAAGLGVDLSQYSTAEQIEFLKDNLPYVNTEIQSLADTITGEGGVLNSTRLYLDELTAAFTLYNQEVQDTLSLAGTSVLSIASTIDDLAIAQTEQWLGLYQNAALETQNVIENMQKLLEEMLKFMNEDFSSSDVIQTLYNAEQMLEKIFNPDQIDENTVLTGTSATIGYGTLGPDQDVNTLTNEQKQMLQSLQDDYLTQQASFNTLADELTASDINSYTENILANADEILDNIYNTYKDDLKNRLEHLLLQEVNSLADITNSVNDLNNTQALDQNVAIEANFPNVTNHAEIEQALNNLVNMASQQAARQRT